MSWPTVAELKKIVDVPADSDYFDETITRQLAAGIALVKQQVGGWDEDTDDPDDMLAGAALRAAYLLSLRETPAAIVGEIFREPPWRGPAPAGPILKARYDFFLWNADPARYPWVVQAFEQHLDNIRSLRRMAEEQGAALVLITAGIPDQGLHRKLRAFLDSEMPYHLDLAEPMARAAQGQRVHYYHDPHWNALGNRLAAEIIDRYLRERGLL